MTLGATIYFPPEWPRRLTRTPDRRQEAPATPRRRLAPAIAAVYVLAMVLLPLRHYVIPGDVKWTGAGYLGSWQVMLSEKSGSARFVVSDDAGRTWVIPPPPYLTERQVSLMATSPDLIIQVAEEISHDMGVSVAADVRLSMNGRPSVQFTNPAFVVDSAVATGWLAQPNS
jgi:hypothetical protein